MSSFPHFEQVSGKRAIFSGSKEIFWKNFKFENRILRVGLTRNRENHEGHRMSGENPKVV